RGVPESEAKMIGSSMGIAARFLVVHEVAPGENLSITVHSAKQEHTRAMQELRRSDAIISLRVVLAPKEEFAAGRGFSFFLSERPRPWGLVVEHVESAARATRDVRRPAGAKRRAK